MLIGHRSHLTETQVQRLDAIDEILAACEPQIRQLLEDHKALSRRWFSHEILPWGRGRSFVDEPWNPDQSPLDPQIVLAFETNLLTEDNLPYYHAHIASVVGEGSSLAEWNRIWTSEEGAHAVVMRDYAHLMRIIDPVRLETKRLEIMRLGFHRDFADPLELFSYTAFQEAATRVSHLKLGQKAGEPQLAKLMSLISRDENFHYIFYRSLVKIVMNEAPELVLPAIMKQLYSFAMPGTELKDFEEREDNESRLGIYGALEHRDLVVKPTLTYWGIEQLTNLPAEAARAQERILKAVRVLDRVVERQQQKIKGPSVLHDGSLEARPIIRG